MTLTRRIAQPETNRMPLEPRQANRPEGFQRSIRPRPLHVDDQVQLVLLAMDWISTAKSSYLLHSISRLPVALLYMEIWPGYDDLVRDADFVLVNIADSLLAAQPWVYCSVVSSSLATSSHLAKTSDSLDMGYYVMRDWQLVGRRLVQYR